MTEPMRELRTGVWYWESPHPDWDKGQWWPELVSSYAIDLGDDCVLFDPLSVPDELRERATAVVLTAPYHERDARRLGLPVHTPPADTWEDWVEKFGVAPERVRGMESDDLAWLRDGEGDGHFHGPGEWPFGVQAYAGREDNDLVLWVPAINAIVTRRTRFPTLAKVWPFSSGVASHVDNATMSPNGCGRYSTCRSSSCSPAHGKPTTARRSCARWPERRADESCDLARSSRRGPNRWAAIVLKERPVMSVAFPGESAEYRATPQLVARKEIELRRAMEAVAVARRALPPGGAVPEDYVFQWEERRRAAAAVRLSDLFAPGKDSLVIYSFMFPRDPATTRAGAWVRADGIAAARRRSVPVVRRFDRSARGGRRARHGPDQTWRSSRRRRCLASSPLRTSAAGDACVCCLRTPTLSTATTSPRRPEETRGRCSMSFTEPARRSATSGLGALLRSDRSRPGPRHVGTLEPLWNLFDLTPEGRPTDWGGATALRAMIQRAVSAAAGRVEARRRAAAPRRSGMRPLHSRSVGAGAPGDSRGATTAAIRPLRPSRTIASMMNTIPTTIAAVTAPR